MRSIFSENTSACRIAYVTQACVDDSDYSSDPAAGAAWYWWLRTPNSSNSHVVRRVGSLGTLHYNDARSGSNGVRPLCNLKKIRRFRCLIFYSSIFFISNNSNFAFSFSSITSFSFSSSLVILSCGVSSTKVSCSA